MIRKPKSANTILTMVRQHCQSISGYPGEYPFGEHTEVYKVGGKMFGYIALNSDPSWIAIKLPPAMGLELRAVYPAGVTPGYHSNKTHWNTIALAGEPEPDEVIELIDISYQLVRSALPRRIRDSLR
jgi:predicted DNA-binding protein (MmcQ/YjbR family)